MKTSVLSIICFMCCATTSCRRSPFESDQAVYKLFTIKIDSDPTGAKLFIDNFYRGQTPVVIELTKHRFTFELRKNGYETWKKEGAFDKDGYIKVDLKIKSVIP